MSKINTRKIRVAVIPAGGKGTRISDLPLTKILPKSMLPILNKPILEHIFEKIIPLGVERIYLVLGHKSKSIRDYFGDGVDFGVKINYIIEPSKKRKGIGAAIYKTKRFINEPFFVILGDDFTITKSLRNLVDDFFNKKALAVTGLVRDNKKESLKRANCVYLGKDNIIKKIIEKPEKPTSKIRGCGIYIFKPSVFAYIKKTKLSKKGFKEITDTLDLMSKRKKVYGVFVNGVNININTFSDLILAMKETIKLND